MSLKCLIGFIMPIFIFKTYRTVVTTMGIYMKGMEVWGGGVCVHARVQACIGHTYKT